MKSTARFVSFIDKHEKWNSELLLLRDMCLNTEMTETIKWGIPTYTINKKNVVSIGAFKDHIALWFHHGSFLKDVDKVLVNANSNTTRGQRQWRFTSISEINERAVIKYLEEAIQNEKDGKRIKLNKEKPLIIPDELNLALKNDDLLNNAFNQFSKAKKREFSDHIISAKRAETKLNRIEKIIPLILKGEGLHDRYK